MIGRIGLRGRTDFEVVAREGSLAARCRGVEVSSSGIVVDRGRELYDRDQRLVMELELRLPEQREPGRALARPVWYYGTHQALKFVAMTDADRLCLAEHLDRLRERGVRLN